MAEALRIQTTGAAQILNSKSVYSRSSLPRIVAMASVEETNMGDSTSSRAQEVDEQEEETDQTKPETFMTEREKRRRRRKEVLKDLLNWGVSPELDEEDEEIVKILTDILDQEDAERAAMTLIEEIIEKATREDGRDSLVNIELGTLEHWVIRKTTRILEKDESQAVGPEMR